MPSGHRVHCIYSTEREGKVSDHPSLGQHHRARHSDALPVTPGEFLRRLGDPPPTDRMEHHYARAGQALPILLGSAPCGSRLAFAGGTDEDPHDPVPGVRDLHLSAFRFPYGGLVLCLSIHLDSDLPALVDLLHRTTFDWRSLQLDGRSLVETAMDLTAVAAELGSVAVATDVHHLVRVDPDQIPVFTDAGTIGAVAGRAGTADLNADVADVTAGAAASPPVTEAPAQVPAGVDHRTVQSLIFRTTKPLRSTHAEVQYPTAANRDPAAVVASGAAVTVLSSGNREFEGWALWSMLSLTAALARLRQVQADAYAVLAEMDRTLTEQHDAPEPADVRTRHAATRAELAALSERLGQLQLHLTFGVVAYLDMQVALPSPTLAHTHRALTGLMGFPGSRDATSELLERATTAVTDRMRALQAHERSLDEARQKKVDLVLAGVAAVGLILTIFFGFFGANASPVSDEHRPFFDGDYAGFYSSLAATAAVVFLLIVRALRHVPRDHTSSPDQDHDR